MRLIARGRPAPQPGRDDRVELLAFFRLVGPRVGLPTLRSRFPTLSRGTLVEYQRRYRRVSRRRGRRWIYALLWYRAGSVWGADLAEPPLTIEAQYGWIVHVRDLPSQKQLLSLPIERPTAANVVAALEALVERFGAPLVLKIDNGSAFIAKSLRAWAAKHGILILHSPPRTPAYNGSIEAGIGSIHTRAHHEAARHDRPGRWTLDDVEAARLQANSIGRPWGRWGPTPDEAWANRTPISAIERARFRNAYRTYALRERIQRGILPMWCLRRHEQAAIDRIAIARALIENGFLSYRRRRITQPIRRRKEQKIS